MTYGIMRTRVGDIMIEVSWEKHHGYRLSIDDPGAGGDYVHYYAKLSSALSAAVRFIKRFGA